MNTNQLSLLKPSKRSDEENTKLISIHELHLSMSVNPLFIPEQISSSRDCVDFFRSALPVDILHREAMIALFLNRRNNAIGYSIISTGGISGTVCDPKIVFQHALLSNSSGIIMCHNHPSGNLNPSQADLKLTKKLKSAGQFLDITILDHVIITESDYHSMADYGEL